MSKQKREWRGEAKGAEAFRKELIGHWKKGADWGRRDSGRDKRRTGKKREEDGNQNERMTQEKLMSKFLSQDKYNLL